MFPPTYAVEGNRETKYAREKRRIGGDLRETVVLDSVASQANRLEVALLEGWELGELSFPVAYVDFRDQGGVSDLGRISALEAPHRIADAIFRDSLLDGTLFRLSDIGMRITEATPRDATWLFTYRPPCCSACGTRPVPREASAPSFSARSVPRSSGSAPSSV